MSGEQVASLVRFSNGSGDPDAHDGQRDGRGMAVKFMLPDGTATDIVAISVPVFPVRTPEAFLEFTRLRKPDPATGQPDMAALGAYLEGHPETAAAVQAALSMEPPASYLSTAYNGIHAFGLVDAGGAVTWVRYRWEPESGVETLPDEEAVAREADYLQLDLAQRLARAPAAFKLVLRLAGEGYPLDDPTAPWPEEAESIVAGRLEVAAPAPDAETDAEVLVFDPMRLTDGVVASDDPILHARPGAYSVSIERRTASS